MEGFEIDEPTLRRYADGLREQGDTLRRRRPDPKPQPDAGRSSGEAAAAIGHLVGATSDLARLCQAMADRVEESLAAYRRADDAAREALEAIARRGR